MITQLLADHCREVEVIALALLPNIVRSIIASPNN